MKLLSGKTAIITGASRGIGKAIAEKFANQGANVAFTYLTSAEKAKELEKELSAIGVKVKAYQSDASNIKACEELVSAVIAEFGTVDILVNNAGITRDNLLLRMTETQWDEVININLKSVFNLTKVVVRYMLKVRKGSIINLTSVVGIEGNAGQSNYAASKAGIIGFTKSIAQELGSRNIRCNAVAPGFIQTEMTSSLNPEIIAEYMKDIPLGRAGSPGEVANLVLFLASDLSSYITGQVISICGGMHT
jgi:3-oxoacyl-[acyl-carrier protein] reductase